MSNILPNACVRCTLRFSSLFKRPVQGIVANHSFSRCNRLRFLTSKHLNDSAVRLTIRQYCSRPIVDSTMDEEELKNFKALANTWWDETGEFEALHAMNKVRIPFIRDGLLNSREDVPTDPSLPLQGLKIVDAGSGGGILAEPLARLGAVVIGVEPVRESVEVAQLHLQQDQTLLPRVKYVCGTVEDLVSTEEESFDALVSSEVLEHVPDKVSFLQSCCKLVKPGGSLFFTTINRTQLSRGLAVFAAERLLRIVPEGTHDWEKFVPPQDLQKILDMNDVHTRKIHGLFYNPVNRHWSFIERTDINYALHAVKAHPGEGYSGS